MKKNIIIINLFIFSFVKGMQILKDSNQKNISLEITKDGFENNSQEENQENKLILTLRKSKNSGGGGSGDGNNGGNSFNIINNNKKNEIEDKKNFENKFINKKLKILIRLLQAGIFYILTKKIFLKLKSENVYTNIKNKFLFLDIIQRNKFKKIE